MTDETQSTKPTSPTAGQLLDTAVIRGRAEWAKRNAADPKFKWYAAGVTSLVALVALLVVCTLLSAIFGPSYPGKPSREAYDRLQVGMEDKEINKLLGTPNDSFYDGNNRYAIWNVDEKTTVILQNPGSRAMSKRWDTEGEWKKLKTQAESYEQAERAHYNLDRQSSSSSRAPSTESSAGSSHSPEAFVAAIDKKLDELGPSLLSRQIWQTAKNDAQGGNYTAATNGLTALYANVDDGELKALIAVLIHKWQK